MKCPVCGNTIRQRKSGQLMRDDRTGFLIRVRLIICPKCGAGKDVVTHQVSFYGDERARRTGQE